MQQLNPIQVKQLIDASNPAPLLLDVREPNEFAYCHIEGALHIPMGQIVSRLDEIDAEREIVVVCHHGMRSFQVAQFLESQGYGRVINLSGGIDAWARDVDPSIPKY
jgi:rhodanese-related sulfurtransferase